VVMSQKMPQNYCLRLTGCESFATMTAWSSTPRPPLLEPSSAMCVSAAHQSLDQQNDALVGAGIDPARIYADKMSGTSTREQRVPVSLRCWITRAKVTPSWWWASTVWAAMPLR
jgi:hypothetical protein